MPDYSDSATVQPPRSIMGFLDAASADAKKIVEWGEVDAAEVIGYAELAGFRYPVKQYSFKVSDTLTRGSRVDAQGLADLKSNGFKGVVNLCREMDDSAAVTAKGLVPLHLAILDNSAPTQDQMRQFLDFATTQDNQQTYVHCEAGKGRTGVAVACYRMGVQGWTVDDALADAEKFGLSLENQIDFLAQFYNDLLAGNIVGYPL